MSKAFSITVKQAKSAAKEIAKSLGGGEILGLIGPLGAGKTTFTQALAKELGVKGVLRSPTFVLMQSFQGKLPQGKVKINIHHLDLYRLPGSKDIHALGLADFLGKKNTLTVIEWADKAKKILPKKTKYIHFQSLTKTDD